MARNSLLCADVPLRNYSLTHSLVADIDVIPDDWAVIAKRAHLWSLLRLPLWRSCVTVYSLFSHYVRFM